MAWDSNSIVDYLKSQGKDSSYSARKKLAQNMGISNYSGTASQNTQMLNALKKGSSTNSNKNNTTNKTNNTKNTKTTTTTKSTTPPEGVDKSIWEKQGSTYTTSEEQKKRDAEVESALSNYKTLTSKEDIISQDVRNVLGSSYTKPIEVIQADAWLGQQLSQIQSGKTSYSDDVRNMISKIQNRDKFEYDVDSDQLFQQALASAMGSGKQAMQDTIGQASALTGGYGSTYATSVGNQAYNSFIEDAYDNLPQYYQMAFEKYQAEGQDMYNQLAMLSEEDAKEYERLLTSYDATYQHRNQLYNESYNAYRDSKTDAYNMANLQLSEHGQLVSDAYNYYNAVANNAETMYQRDYNTWLNEINQSNVMSGMQQTNYWNQTNFDEGVRQYEKNFTESQRQFNKDLELNQAKFDWEKEMAEKEFGAKYVSDGKGGYVSKTGNGDGNGGSGGSGSNKLSNGASVTSMVTYKQKALDAYNKGGDSAVDTYVDSLGLNESEKAEIGSYVYGDGNGDKGNGTLPLSMRTFTKTKDTTNWFWGVDNNDEVSDQYGNKWKLSDLKKELKAEGIDSKVIDNLLDGLTDTKKGKTYTYSSK